MMKTLEIIKTDQKDFIQQCELKTKSFLKSLNLKNIEYVLLSGSVSRGDYMPGKYGGMIDLTVVKSKNVNIDASDLFGEDEEPEIPYHCVNYLGQGFQIAIYDYIEISDFNNFNEPQKFAFLESKLLYEKTDLYRKIIKNINTALPNKLKQKKNEGLGYIDYLLSEYKTDRWITREAYPQLHSNLNKAVEIALKCLYYTNGTYSPAEDRILYYCYTIPKNKTNFDKIITELYKQDIISLEDYKRRVKIFNDLLLPMITN